MAGAALLAEPRSPHTHTHAGGGGGGRGPCIFMPGIQEGAGPGAAANRGPLAQSRSARTAGTARPLGGAAPGGDPEPRARPGLSARGRRSARSGRRGPRVGRAGARRQRSRAVSGLGAAGPPRTPPLQGEALLGPHRRPAPLRGVRWPPQRRSSEPGRLSAEGQGGQAPISALGITVPIGFLGLAFRGNPDSIQAVRVLPPAPTPTPSN